TTIKFSVVGDLMCHSTQYNYARVGKDSFDFRDVYKYVKPIFDSSDFVMGNLRANHTKCSNS
ncbi:CapA family protein, partial [bacterium]|nr:CapA family protein [bacterium]